MERIRMMWGVWVTLLAVGFAASPVTATDGPDEARILSTLEEMRRTGRTYLSISEQTGRMLRVLTEASNARHVVEVGTSTGYSGLWFALGLSRTGGRLTTFELDAGRAGQARENFRQAGVDRLIKVVEGDAHETVLQLKDPIDILFLDADKSGYLDYLRKLLPLVRPGGLIIADNINMARDFERAVTTDPNLETIYWSEGGQVSVTLKKRAPNR